MDSRGQTNGKSPAALNPIKLLDEIGAKLDLTKALYQLGLTYQAANETEKSRESFQEAIRLFAELEAPKQMESVRQSMQNILWEDASASTN